MRVSFVRCFPARPSWLYAYLGWLAAGWLRSPGVFGRADESCPARSVRLLRALLHQPRLGILVLLRLYRSHHARRNA